MAGYWCLKGRNVLNQPFSRSFGGARLTFQECSWCHVSCRWQGLGVSLPILSHWLDLGTPNILCKAFQGSLIESGGGLFVGWLLNVPATCQCVSQERICSDNFTCCHTEIEAADPTFHLTQSQYTDTGSTNPSTHPITSGAWQGSHWSARFEVTYWYDSTPEKSWRKRDSNPGPSVL